MKKEFSISLVFDDLRRGGKSINGTEEYIDATALDLHPGSTFPGTITLEDDAAYDFEIMLEGGLQPVFWVSYRFGEKG